MAVIVVPMFSPNTIAEAISKLIHPLATISIVSAIAALEDWQDDGQHGAQKGKDDDGEKFVPRKLLDEGKRPGYSLRSGTEFS